MFLVFGMTVRFRTVGEGTVHCPSCAADRECRRREARRWVTFFFIPVVPAGRLGEIVECATCGGRFDQHVLDAPTAARTAIELGIARRALVAHMVEVSGNTTVARDAAVAAQRDAGEVGYGVEQLDVDRATSDRARVAGWLVHLQGTLSVVGAEALLMAAARIAAADGRLDEAELEAMADLGDALGLTPIHVEGIIHRAEVTSRDGRG